MSKHNRNRSVTPATLENPERAAEPLKTPEGEGPLEERADDDDEEEDEEDDTELINGSAALAGLVDEGTLSPPVLVSERERRLAEASSLQPAVSHWAAMWAAGRNAVVKALRDGATIAAVHALAPPDGAGCRDCWMRGRDAALRVIQGV